MDEPHTIAAVWYRAWGPVGSKRASSVSSRLPAVGRRAEGEQVVKPGWAV